MLILKALEQVAFQHRKASKQKIAEYPRQAWVHGSHQARPWKNKCCSADLTWQHHSILGAHAQQPVQLIHHACTLFLSCMHILHTRLGRSWGQSGKALNMQWAILNPTRVKTQPTTSVSGWAKLHIFPSCVHIFQAPGLGVHNKIRQVLENAMF